MTTSIDAIHVQGLRLWAHVGVFEQERRDGQWFELEFWLGGDLRVAAEADELAGSFDYALAITSLQRQSRTVRCLTIEHYSEQILNLLEQLYGSIAIRLELSKCQPPIPGFQGRVSVLRQRRWGGVAPADG
ncbi:MAG: dihydroneopterin aldolase [Synechococcaceae cyanobacterium ELA739]